MSNTQHPHQKNNLGFFCLLLILSFFLVQCGKTPKESNNATHTSDGGFSLKLPSALKKHQSGKNITAQLIIDGGTPIDMSVDLDNDQVIASTGPLSPGIHSFVIQYFLDGALITTATSQATIISGQNINIVFTPDLNVNIAPTILATQPTANATDIAVNSTLSATFSQPMDTASIIPMNFTLSDLTGAIAGSLSYTETPPSFEARFTPTQTLALAATYTANLSTGISGILGEPLSTAQNWTFTTADGIWGNAESVDDNSSENTASPQIAVDPNGNAIAVWVQTNVGASGPDNIWANRYLKGIGWETPELIEMVDAGHATSPQVAVAPNGNAIVIWQQNDGTRNNIWVNHFNANTSAWGSREGLETDNTGDAESPQIGIASNGNAIAIWQQNDGASINIMSNRFNQSLGTWGTATAIETGSGTARTPQVALASNGDALAVWSQHDGMQFSIFANRYNIGTSSWGTEEAIESNNAGDASIPQIAVNSSGTAITVWLQNDGIVINVESQRFIPDTGWAASATRIDTESTQAFTPEIGIDPQGNAFVLWRQSDGTTFHIYSNRFDSNSALWGTPTPLETGNVANIGFPKIAFDLHGNAIAVWAQRDQGETYDNILSNRFTQGTGWKTAEKIETEDMGNSGFGFPQIDMDASGNAFALWLQDDGTTINVQSNRFQ